VVGGLGLVVGGSRLVVNWSVRYPVVCDRVVVVDGWGMVMVATPVTTD